MRLCPAGQNTASCEELLAATGVAKVSETRHGEATAHSKQQWAAPKEVNVDAAVASVISELESISSLKETQRTTLEDFLDGKHVFALLPTGFGKGFD